MPANQITGLAPGEVFVHRNVGNLVVHTDLNCLAVIDFAVDLLQVRHVIVVGHHGCSGVRMALRRSAGGLAEHWLRHLQDVQGRHASLVESVTDADEKVNLLAELNVLEQASNVCESTSVREAWRQREVVEAPAEGAAGPGEADLPAGREGRGGGEVGSGLQEGPQELGSAAELEARRHLEQGRIPLEIKTYPGAIEALTALRNGEVDAAIADSVNVYHFARDPGGIRYVKRFLSDEQYVIALRLDRPRRTAEIQQLVGPAQVAEGRVEVPRRRQRRGAQQGRGHRRGRRRLAGRRYRVRDGFAQDMSVHDSPSQASRLAA